MNLFQIKMCRTCHDHKYFRDFYTSVGAPDGLMPDCKKCSSSKSNAKQVERYGITEEDYQRMHAAQDGKCFICDSPESARLKGTLKRLGVDHCHTQGHVRRLLCTKCNTGLGMFRDRPELLRRAADYLEEHKDAGSEDRGSRAAPEPKTYTQESQRKARAPSEVRITSGQGTH